MKNGKRRRRAEHGSKADAAAPLCSAAPEFSRIVDVSRLGQAAHSLAIEAKAVERAALAERFGLVSLDQLSAALTIRRCGEDGLIELSGRIMARLQQACVVTLEPVIADIDQPLRIFYGEGIAVDGTVADPLASDDDAEPLDQGHIDCGEAVAQQLAVALDPYPRSPGAKVSRPAGRTED